MEYYRHRVRDATLILSKTHGKHGLLSWMSGGVTEETKFHEKTFFFFDLGVLLSSLSKMQIPRNLVKQFQQIKNN